MFLTGLPHPVTHDPLANAGIIGVSTIPKLVTAYTSSPRSACLCRCMGRPRVTSACLSLLLPFCFWRQGPLAPSEPEAQFLIGWLAHEPPGCLCPQSPALQLSTCAAAPGPSAGSEDLNVDPCACTASTFPAEHLPSS